MRNWAKVAAVLALAGSPLLMRQLLHWYENRRALVLRKEVYRKPKF